MISFVFETLRILVIGSRAGRTRFPSESGQSMESGSAARLEKLSMAIREINKKIRSERAGGGSSADPKKTDGRLSWPFCARAVLCVWAVTLERGRRRPISERAESMAEGRAAMVVGAA